MDVKRGNETCRRSESKRKGRKKEGKTGKRRMEAAGKDEKGSKGIRKRTGKKKRKWM